MTRHSHIDDDLLRRALEAGDPLRGKELLPFTLTPAEMRSEVDRKAAVAPRMNRRRVIVGAAATMGAAAAAYVVWPSAAIAAPGRLDIDFTKPGKPAADWLTSLADALKSEPSIANLGNTTTYAHLQRWVMDTIDPASQLIAQDIQIWWHPDRSGRELLTTLPAQPSGQRIAQYLEPSPPGKQMDPIRYGPGQYSSLIDVPSTNPDRLKSQLDTHEPPANGPKATLRAIADVAAIHDLNMAQRRAFLIVLAGIPSLLWRGITKDRAGRTCNVLSIDSGDTSQGLRRDLLLVSIAGEIYGHEAIALTPPPRSPISNDTVIEYTLHLETRQPA
ncbi:MAG TPA: hypothetical protein DGG94_13940 [Micromonosporaceae bacterium]|nr:hypothetical protein [Micromonosporaceae bacterium]HCU50878.1 hypothetical protein [Micromonosporaceae bacterium]